MLGYVCYHHDNDQDLILKLLYGANRSIDSRCEMSVPFVGVVGIGASAGCCGVGFGAAAYGLSRPIAYPPPPVPAYPIPVAPVAFGPMLPVYVPNRMFLTLP